MTKDQHQAADRLQTVRYYVHHTPLDASPAGLMEASSLQEGDK